MGTAVTQEQIVSSLLDYLPAQLTSGVSVSYIGDQVNAETLSEWAEFYISGINHSKSRVVSKDQRRGHIRVLIFVKPGANLYRHWEILRDFKTALTRKTIQLSNFNASGAEVGSIRTFNARINPMTREIGESRGVRVYSIEMTFPIAVQEM